MQDPTDVDPNAIPSGRASVPVIRNFDVTIPPLERRRLAEIAAKLLRDEPSLSRTDFHGALVFPGLSEAPAVLLGDQREIGLHESLPEQTLEHRIALLAAEGDLVALESDCAAHERYLAELLGVADLRVIALGPPEARRLAPVATRCRESGLVLGQFVDKASDAGHFQIIPHIGAGSAWTLAGAIARETGVPVGVAAPPPRLTRRVNDKIWFANRLRDVLGPTALPPTYAAFGAAAVAARIAHVARTSERVIVKTPDSAGSMGNVTIDAALVRGLSLGSIRNLVLSKLHGRGWRGGFPLLVGVWEADALASPSVQIWIPSPRQGGPAIEGMFEQRLAGPDSEFIGAVPASLPPPIIGRMAGESMRFATLFQDLGYFGRCSFDCIVTGAADGGPEVHWIECNGRWGGVSVPMTFVNRLFGNHARRGLVIVQDTTLRLAINGVGAVHRRLGPLLLRRGDAQGVVPLSARWLTSGNGIHFLAVAETQEKAEHLAADAIARLTAAR